MSHRPRNDKSPENERRRRQKRAEQEESSESDSDVGYSDLESEVSDDDALSPMTADEIAAQIQSGNFENLKTILTKSMAEQTIRQWTVDEEEEVYTPNLNAVRGRALIINNHTFRRLGTRDGTNVDRERMYHLLKLMRYETTIKDNLRAKQMLKAVSKFSTKIAHNAGDSVVLVILTHGSSGRLYGVDDRYLSIDDLLGPLNNKNCPHLAGKPKIVILQCCRGNEPDPGVSHARNEQSTSRARSDQRRDSPRRVTAPTEKLRRLPTDGDFLICCATTDSRVSWRSDVRGSRFIQAICECFARHSAVDDILRLMTRVNAVVAAMNSNKKVGYLQVSEERFTLTKLFFFFPTGR
ncbi:Ced-3p [Globodera pallida]|nr:Ced-3p [Globodera pallida]